MYIYYAYLNLGFELLSCINYTDTCLSNEMTFRTENYQMKGIHFRLYFFKYWFYNSLSFP